MFQNKNFNALYKTLPEIFSQEILPWSIGTRIADKQIYPHAGTGEN